jgi:integrase/recombinase XerD
MALTIYRRHAATCPHISKGRRWHRCQCPIWVQGSLGKEYVRQSLNLTVWGAAQERVRGWEASGQVGVVHQNIPTIREAVEKHIADAEARHLKPESVKKIRDILQRRLLDYCGNRGCRFLRQLDVDAIREFRNRLVKTYSPNSARKRLEYVRAFFRFCHQSGWITANPAAVIKPPRADQSPTLPFDKDEMQAILEAADSVRTQGKFRQGNRLRIRAMILLLRYAGLRISDAAVLERSRLADDKLFLYTQKTGTPVWVPLPPRVVQALQQSPSDNPQYFFWNGRSLPTSAVKIWERTFERVFELANIPNGTLHRFRDTFAVELLLKGVPIEQVSILLGHSSLKVTEKHYAPWVKARQEQLERSVRLTWDAESTGHANRTSRSSVGSSSAIPPSSGDAPAPPPIPGSGAFDTRVSRAAGDGTPRRRAPGETAGEQSRRSRPTARRADRPKGVARMPSRVSTSPDSSEG